MSEPERLNPTSSFRAMRDAYCRNQDFEPQTFSEWCDHLAAMGRNIGPEPGCSPDMVYELVWKYGRMMGCVVPESERIRWDAGEQIQREASRKARTGSLRAVEALADPFSCPNCGGPLTAWSRDNGFRYCSAHCRRQAQQ